MLLLQNFKAERFCRNGVWFVSYTVSKFAGDQKKNPAKKKFKNDNLNCQK